MVHSLRQRLFALPKLLFVHSFTAVSVAGQASSRGLLSELGFGGGARNFQLAGAAVAG